MNVYKCVHGSSSFEGKGMNELIQGFEQWLFEEGRSEKTIESYVGDVKRFQIYLNEKASKEKQPLFRFSFVRYKQHC